MIHLDWVKNSESDKDKEDFESILRNNTRIFRRLSEILTEWEDSLNRQERGKDQYETPNWDKLQAHRNGNIEILQKLRDLISFK